MTCTLERNKRLRAVFLSKDSDLGRELADVEFQVTDAVSGESRAFHSVRALCAVFSPVLKAMFFGHMAEARCSVPVTDCRLQGFEWLLAYIYGLQPKLSAANVVSVLQCAAKYGVTEIVDACVALISEMQAIDDMLPIAAQIERLKLDSIPALKRAMDSLFADARFAAAAIQSPNFAQSATAVVRGVLRSERLPLKEEMLWQKCVQWARHQWADGTRVDEEKDEVKDDSVADQSDDSGWQQLLRPFLPLFRFPVMDQKFVCAEVLSTGILSSEQIVSLYMAQNLEDAHCEFSAVPRSLSDSKIVEVSSIGVDSKILEVKEFLALSKRVGKCVDLSSCKLLFRGTDKGFAAAKFHELCDNKGATLTVVLTEFGHVIGGFASIPWTSAGLKADTKAWLFVARVNESKKKEYTSVSLPAILKANTAKSDHIFGHLSFGPTFGSSADLFIANDCDTQIAYCGCTEGTSFIPVCDGVTLDTLAITGGNTLKGTKSHFRVVNYEVFSVK